MTNSPPGAGMAVILNEKPLPSLCVQAAPISVQLDLPSRSLQTLKILWVGRLEGVVVIGWLLV